MLLTKENGRRALIVAWAIVFTLALPYLLDGVEILGRRIPQFDRASDFLKGISLGGGLWLTIYLFPISSRDKKNLSIVWGIKLLVTLGLMLFYEWSYGLDAYWYFHRSQQKIPDFSRVGWGNGTENLVAFFWTLEHQVFALHSYHALKVLSSFVGLLGIYLFYRAFTRYLRLNDPRLLLYLGLFPSILFWSSILGKDPFVLFALCLAWYGALSFMRERQALYLIPLTFGLLLLGFLRSWMIGVLVVPLLVGGVMGMRSTASRLLFLVLIGCACLYSMRFLSQGLALESAEALTDQMNRVARSWQKGGSAGDIPQLTSMGAILRYLPYGMFTALFRPLPGDVMNLFGLLAGLENLFLLYLMWQAWVKRHMRLWRNRMVAWFVTYVIIWSALYAFISPQNLGSSVRFKLQVLPILLLLLTYLAGWFRPQDDAYSSNEDTYSTEESAPPHTY